MKTISHHKLQELVTKWKTEPLYQTADFLTASHELQGLLDGDQPVPAPASPELPQPPPAAPLPAESATNHEKEADQKGQPTHKETTRPERVQSDDAENEHVPTVNKVGESEKKGADKADQRQTKGVTTSDKVAHK